LLRTSGSTPGFVFRRKYAMFLFCVDRWIVTDSCILSFLLLWNISDMIRTTIISGNDFVNIYILYSRSIISSPSFQ
jgi:hypothetical protein